MKSRDSAVLLALCNLRWLAVACQCVVVVVAGRIGVELPAVPLWGAIAVLAAFNVYALHRGRVEARIAPAEVFAHMAVDVSVLAWLIAWSGGITNPFTSLFLLPIAFAALALPTRWIYATTAICGLGYAACALFGRPLPHVHGSIHDSFDLHLIGMVVNFILSVGVVLYFFARLAGTLRHRDEELALLRERFARNEGIVALGTHAASVAHELNTPLGTLTLMLDDLLAQEIPDEARGEIAAMRAVVDVCRDRVRELAAPAGRTNSDGTVAKVDLERVIDHWAMTRPTIALARSGPRAALPLVEPAVGHLLQALLNNAADAGEAAGRPRVELVLRASGTTLEGEILDEGDGIVEGRTFLPGQLFSSSKADGLGVGLALGHATVERLGGSLAMRSTDTGGLCVSFRLPMQPDAVE